MAGDEGRTDGAPDASSPAATPPLDNAPARTAWDWLVRRDPERPVRPDSKLRDDLGIDSMDWLRLALEIERRSGVRWSDESIARVETVRDLLHEAGDRSRAGEAAGASFLDAPEANLSAHQRRWLQPLNARQARLATLLHRINRTLMRGLFRLRVKGLHRVPETQLVLTPTHGSFLDPFALAAALGRERLARTFWAADARLAFGNPLSRFVSRLGQAVPFESHDGYVAGMTAAAVVLERGHSLIWFPEGWRSRTGALQDFKPGIGMLLARFPVPVVPVAIRGAHEAYPPGRIIPRPRAVIVGFGEALDPARLERLGDGATPEDRITEALRRHTAALHEETGRLMRNQAG